LKALLGLLNNSDKVVDLSLYKEYQKEVLCRDSNKDWYGHWKEVLSCEEYTNNEMVLVIDFEALKEVLSEHLALAMGFLYVMRSITNIVNSNKEPLEILELLKPYFSVEGNQFLEELTR